MKISYLQTGPH